MSPASVRFVDRWLHLRSPGSGPHVPRLAVRSLCVSVVVPGFPLLVVQFEHPLTPAVSGGLHASAEMMKAPITVAKAAGPWLGSRSGSGPLVPRLAVSLLLARTRSWSAVRRVGWLANWLSSADVQAGWLAVWLAIAPAGRPVV